MGRTGRRKRPAEEYLPLLPHGMTETDSCEQVQKEACPLEKDVSPLTPNLTIAKQAWLPPQPASPHRFKGQLQPVLGVLGSRVRETAVQAPVLL